MHSRTYRWLLPVLGLTSSVAYGAQNAVGSRPSTLPSFAQLQTGWNVLRPGGDTTCAKGGEYSFFVRPGARDKLLVFFQGGGACATGEECDRGQLFYTPELQPGGPFPRFSDGGGGGIFDISRPDNPFSAHSMVFVRYCTGDVHLGDRTATYTVKTEGGAAREFQIHHRGQANVIAVLQWVYQNFPAPREIFVTGLSAGAPPTPFYASALSRRYPRARVIGLGDATAHVNDTMKRNDVREWGLPGVLRRHEGWTAFPDSFTPSQTYITAAQTTPGLRLYWVNHAYDAVMRSTIRDRRGNKNVDLLAALRATLREVSRRVDTFRHFTIGGRAHGVMALDLFYASESNGQRLRDWVAAIAAGQPVASVDCVDCSRAELRFTERDLRIVERSLQLVSAPGAWNAESPPQTCGPKLDRYSLECALSTATNEMAGRPYFQLAAAWEVIFTAIRRMGPYFEKRDQEPQRGLESAFPLRVYNGQPGRTVADVISLLEEVRDRIRADLRQRAKQ